MLQMHAFLSFSSLYSESFSWLSFSFAESNQAIPPEGLRDPVQQPAPGKLLASCFAVQTRILRTVTDCNTQQIVNK